MKHLRTPTRLAIVAGLLAMTLASIPTAAAVKAIDLEVPIGGGAACVRQRASSMHWVVEVAGSTIRDGPAVGNAEVNWIYSMTGVCGAGYQNCTFTIHDGSESTVNVLVNSDGVLVTGDYRGLPLVGDEGSCSSGMFSGWVTGVQGVMKVTAVDEGSLIDI